MLRPSPELNHRVNVQAHSQINSQDCGCYLTHLLIGITREAKGIARVWALYTLEQLSQNLRMRNLGSGDSHLSPGPRATDLVTPTRVRCEQTVDKSQKSFLLVGLKRKLLKVTFTLQGINYPYGVLREETQTFYCGVSVLLAKYCV